MGGAVASILAYNTKVVARDRLRVVVFTFGTPPFATNTFKETYEATVDMHIDFCLPYDPIHAFPIVSSVKLTPYLHVGECFELHTSVPFRAADPLVHHRTQTYIDSLTTDQPPLKRDSQIKTKISEADATEVAPIKTALYA